LEAEARRYLEAQGGELARMSVVVMDARTGELKAIAEPGRAGDDAAVMAYEPQLVGSVAKPLVAAAILALRPELAQLRVPYGGREVRRVGNVPLKGAFENPVNAAGCGSVLDFADFLRCSSNQ